MSKGNKIKIALVAGGDSSEYQVSLKSMEGLKEFLACEAFELTPVILQKEAWQAMTSEGAVTIDKNDFTYLTADRKRYKFDFAYITIHGTPGENGLLPAYFELIGLPHSTCSAFVGAFTFNKYFCNRFFAQLGFNVADAVLIRRGDDYDPNALAELMGLPLFVKPNNGGSSIKNRKVKTVDEICDAVADAMSEGGEVLIERLLNGTELTCGCYRDEDGIHALPVTEVRSENEFFDYDAKYNGEVLEITPAKITPELFAEVQKQTKQIYGILNAKGIIRADFFLSPDNKIFLVEVNTTPGMTPTSFIPQQVEAAGMSMQDLMKRIVTFILK